MTIRSPYLRRVTEIIMQHGHAVQYVPGDLDTGTRPFAYTVGLHAQDNRGYELAVSGLDAETSHGLLNTIPHTLADHSLEPIDGLELDGVLKDGLLLRLRPVSHPERLAIIAALYDAPPVVWQALWPDRHGRFPNDDQLVQPWRAQPLL